MLFTLCEWSKPGVEVIVGKVLSIDELVDCSWIGAVAHQKVYVAGRSLHVLATVDHNRQAVLIEDLYTS